MFFSDRTLTIEAKIGYLTDLGLKRRELARLAGVNLSTISRWARGHEPVEHPDEIDQLYVICETLLEGTTGAERFAVAWLRSRNRGLRTGKMGPVTPLQALADDRFNDVFHAVERQRAGVVATPPQPSLEAAFEGEGTRPTNDALQDSVELVGADEQRN